MRLHGNDIDETTTVLEADLGWIVGWNKATSSAPTRCARQKADGRRRASWSASRCSIAGIARQGYDVFVGGEQAGAVTSGTQTPFLKKAIGMAYLPVGRDSAGHRVRRRHPRTPRARAGRPMPFYKRRT